MRSVRTVPAFFAIIFGLWLTGCAATAPPALPPSPPVTAEPQARAESPRAGEYALADVHVLENRLRAEAEAWYGTPYRYGGTDRDGIDCSAFARALFRQALGLSLPRVTADQVHEGVAVHDARYQPGDLIFFLPGEKTRHVGVYLGAGEFVHASSSRGVTLARIDDPYWQSVYWTTRRLLPDVAAASASAPTPASTPRQAKMPASSWSSRPSPPRPAARSGW